MPLLPALVPVELLVPVTLIRPSTAVTDPAPRLDAGRRTGAGRPLPVAGKVMVPAPPVEMLAAGQDRCHGRRPCAVALADAGDRDIAGAGRDMPQLVTYPLSEPPVPPPVPFRVMLPAPVLVIAAVWLMPKLLVPLELPPVPVIEIAPPLPLMALADVDAIVVAARAAIVAAGAGDGDGAAAGRLDAVGDIQVHAIIAAARARAAAGAVEA